MTEVFNTKNQQGDNKFDGYAVIEAHSAPSLMVDDLGMPLQKEARDLTCEETSGVAAVQPNHKLSRRRSTGPRTAAGKRRSSRNSVKFGIFSQAILLKAESRTEYQIVLNALRKSKKPGDEFEEMMLEIMACDLWRLCRVIIAENAEITKSELEVISEKTTSDTKSIFELDDLVSQITATVGFKNCLEILAELRHGIEANGFNEKQDRSLLQAIYGDPKGVRSPGGLHDQYLHCFETARVSEEERSEKEYPPPEQCVRVILNEIEEEINRIKMKHKENETRKSIVFEKKELEILRQRVPDSPVLDRLMRYETALRRGFDRMLIQYERAQRIRLGQSLAPQIDVRIS